MPALEERSAGFILFRRSPDADPSNAIRYLVLDYGKHWDFAKGHLEPGETDLQAARRELAEETGVTDIEIVPDFARQITYFFRHKKRGLIKKTVTFFLAETQSQTVVLSPEHKGYDWLPDIEAEWRVTYANARQVLRDAHEFLTARQQQNPRREG